MRISTLVFSTLLAIAAGSSLSAYASGGHGHGHGDEHENEAAQEAKGPNGGRLLRDGDFAVEVTIFETGVPPEMRLYAYNHHEGEQPLAPDAWQASVTLDRLGGRQDRLRFTPELDYRVGDQEIVEPHSYDVTVNARYQGRDYSWQFESHEGRTTISDRQLTLAGLETERAGAATLVFKDTLFGVIAAPTDGVYRINAPYPGLVEQVHVAVGEQVKKGQTLLTLTNTATLQRYRVDSPSDGEVSARRVNRGDRAEQGVLLEIVDLSQVWVEMSAFPESIDKLAIGQPVTVSDLHHHEVARGRISYIAPQMTGGHIARTRAVIDNTDGHWRPGMHVKAEVETARREVPLAIDARALQRFREMPVVFAKYGNTFEVRMVALGENNGERIEVLGGLVPGTEYVTTNSFLIKADVLKDGASHDH